MVYASDASQCRKIHFRCRYVILPPVARNSDTIYNKVIQNIFRQHGGQNGPGLSFACLKGRALR